MPTFDLAHEPDLVAAPTVLARFKRALNLSMAAVIVLAAVFFAQGQFNVQAFAIQPQVPAGLVGILTAPLLHGSVAHLASNALSVLILGTLAGTVFPRATLRALPVIWLGSGLGTWLIATQGYHLGASGVTHGLGFLVFTLGVLRRDRPSIAAAMIAFFFFGGMLMTVLPQQARRVVGIPPGRRRDRPGLRHPLAPCRSAAAAPSLQLGRGRRGGDRRSRARPAASGRGAGAVAPRAAGPRRPDH